MDMQPAIFIGQHFDNQPRGFVRVIYKDGSIYEGSLVPPNEKNKENQEVQDLRRNGWGRHIFLNTVQIGWWRNSKLHGNSRQYHSNKLVHDGWF